MVGENSVANHAEITNPVSRPARPRRTASAVVVVVVVAAAVAASANAHKRTCMFTEEITEALRPERARKSESQRGQWRSFFTLETTESPPPPHQTEVIALHVSKDPSVFSADPSLRCTNIISLSNHFGYIPNFHRKKKKTRRRRKSTSCTVFPLRSDVVRGALTSDDAHRLAGTLLSFFRHPSSHW